MPDRPIEIATSLVRHGARSTEPMIPGDLIGELSQERIADLRAVLQSSPPS